MIKALHVLFRRANVEAERKGAMEKNMYSQVLNDSPLGLPVGLAYLLLAVSFLLELLNVFSGAGDSQKSAVITGLFYLMCLVALVSSRIPGNGWLAGIAYGFLFLLSVVYNVMFRSTAGDLILMGLATFFVYRLPPRYSLPIVAAVLLFVVVEHGLGDLVFAHNIQPLANHWSQGALFIFFCWAAWTFRVRRILILRLEATRERLQMEMQHTAELATLQERTRIARDIHDVLAHSLTILSVQVQAMRQIAQQQPDSIPMKLDELAVSLRESMAESRRVVRLLRDATDVPAVQISIGERLQVIGNAFGERMGMKFLFTETGTALPTSEQCAETLQYALQEALTNAHRHGAAQTVVAELLWLERAVTLTVRDDGKEQPVEQRNEGTGNGLRGMRERAELLDGWLEADRLSEGGFTVTICLPLEAASPTMIEAVQTKHG